MKTWDGEEEQELEAGGHREWSKHPVICVCGVKAQAGWLCSRGPLCLFSAERPVDVLLLSQLCCAPWAAGEGRTAVGSCSPVVGHIRGVWGRGLTPRAFLQMILGRTQDWFSLAERTLKLEI